MKPDSVGLAVGAGDRYDLSGVIHLSAFTAYTDSDLARLCAAHECAHAIQHAGGSLSFRFWRVMRSRWWPATAFVLCFAGLASGWSVFGLLGLCFGIGFLRHKATMWIEREAWQMALRWLESRKLLDDVELARHKAQAMLTTYRTR